MDVLMLKQKTGCLLFNFPRLGENQFLSLTVNIVLVL